ncbi:MAG: citrate (Si)-synthase [Chloroflexi bacterium]|nr:citrate (Si)-synthase [Chloroflexota bacterium]
MATAQVQLQRGLKGVYIDTSEASFIDGEIGKLLYRGYNIHDLAENCTFEEVVYLLLYGKLPTRKQLAELDKTLKENRSLPKGALDVIRVVQQAHPMDVLRTAVSALSAFDPEAADLSREATIRKGIRLTAQAPTIVAAHDRIRKGLKPVAPNPNLGHAANFLYMLQGTEPDPEDARTLDVDFVLHAEHGVNASAFAARVAASTNADLHCAVAAGVATLKGPWHGGAAEAVMKMVREVADPERARAYAENLLSRGDRVMGFGHRVYKAEDPRARHLRERSRTMGEKKGHPEWFRILQRFENDIMAPYRAKGIFVNVDFYAGSIYYLLGVPDDLFVPIFAMGRVPGWTVQVVEQFSNNILLRPLLQYIGPMDVPFVPIDRRTG